MITADTTARLEIIKKYRPSCSVLVEAFGQDVVDDLLAKGLISADDPEHCTLTAYALSELGESRPENPVEPPHETPVPKTPSAPLEKETVVRPKSPYAYSHSIISLLEYIDTENLSYDKFRSFFGEKRFAHLFDNRVLIVEDGICRLTDRGRAILEKGMTENFLHPDSCRLSAFSVLCCIVMAIIAIVQIGSTVLDFNSDFIFADSISIATIQLMALQIPHHVCICLGTLLYLVAAGLSKRNLSLVAVILFVCSFFFWPSLYIGIACVPVLALGILGYIFSKKS